MSTPNPTIPKGSWVLVTGVTGFVASHVAQEFLKRGYRVRGTVRDIEKASWLLTGVLKLYADKGDLELVVVPDLGAPNAFDTAVKGVRAVVHIATVTTFDPDPSQVIPQTVAWTTSILDAALGEPSVQELVYTSSIVAATMPMPGNTTHVEADTWNDTAVELAWAPPPYEPSRSMIVYMASKVAAEKEVWRFVREKQPHFTVNCINPASILGQPLVKKHVESKAAWVRMIWDGEVDDLARFPATYVIDVKDVAVLHVAIALDPSVKNARLHASGRSCNWNDILAILRKLRPEREFIPDFPNPQHLSISTDSKQSLSLLKEWGHQDGWKTLEETVSDNLEFLE